MSEKNKVEFNVNNLLKLYWQRRKFIGIFVISFLAVIFAYSFIAPVEYESEASILPPDEKGSGGSLSGFLQTLSGGISLGEMGKSNEVMLISEYLESRELAGFVADTLHLYDAPEFKGQQKEVVEMAVLNMLDHKVKRSGVIYLWATVSTSFFPSGDDADKAARFSAKVANAAIEGIEYISRKKSVSTARRKRIFIERILNRKRHELDSLDALIEEFRQKNEVFEIESQTEAMVENAIKIGAELSKAELELNLKLQEYNPGSAIISAYRHQVDNLREQYRKIQQGGLVPGDEMSIPLKKVPALIRRYRNLVRDQKILEQVNLYLETQRYQEAIQEESDIPAVEALDKAQVPIFKSAPNKKLMLLLGFIISNVLAMLIVTVRAVLKGRLVFSLESREEGQA